VHVIEALEPVGDRLGGFRVRVEGMEPFRVPETLLQRRDLEPGVRLTTAQIEALRAEANDRVALDRAVLYLSYRPRTCQEVKRHLAGHGLSRQAGSAIERCRELGYLDDERYARTFVRERLRLKPRGGFRLVSELLGRGIDREVAERAVREVMEEEGRTEAAILEDVAADRARKLRRLDPPVARRRLAAFLGRRGFRAADIREVVLRMLPDEPDP
jgi:regulatory protein